MIKKCGSFYLSYWDKAPNCIAVAYCRDAWAEGVSYSYREFWF